MAQSYALRACVRCMAFSVAFTASQEQLTGVQIVEQKSFTSIFCLSMVSNGPTQWLLCLCKFSRFREHIRLRLGHRISVATVVTEICPNHLLSSETYWCSARFQVTDTQAWVFSLVPILWSCQWDMGYDGRLLSIPAT